MIIDAVSLGWTQFLHSKSHIPRNLVNHRQHSVGKHPLGPGPEDMEEPVMGPLLRAAFSVGRSRAEQLLRGTKPSLGLPCRSFPGLRAIPSILSFIVSSLWV